MLELHALQVDAAAVVLTAVSVCFAFISAYITGLYFFLHRAPLTLRLAGFVLLSLSLLFVILIGAGVSPLAGGLVLGARLQSVSLEDLASGDVDLAAMAETALTEAPLFYLIGWGVGLLLCASVYLALAFLTFFYRWPDEAAR